VFGRTHGVLELIGNDVVNAGLEEVKQWEPDSRPFAVVLIERLIVGQSVVVEEESRRYVERDEHVDGVVLVSGQYEEYAE